MGLRVLPYKDILIPLYIIPHLMIFFKVLFSFREPFRFLISVGCPKKIEHGSLKQRQKMV